MVIITIMLLTKITYVINNSNCNVKRIVIINYSNNNMITLERARLMNNSNLWDNHNNRLLTIIHSHKNGTKNHQSISNHNRIILMKIFQLNNHQIQCKKAQISLVHNNFWLLNKSSPKPTIHNFKTMTIINLNKSLRNWRIKK